MHAASSLAELPHRVGHGNSETYFSSKSRIARGHATTGYIDSAAAMLVGYARLPDDLLPWTVVVAEPLANAFAPARRMVNSSSDGSCGDLAHRSNGLPSLPPAG